jgi:hypothetical protein
MLKSILENLRDGRELKINYLENQYGEDICIKNLFFQDGSWVVGELNCRSSSDYGFGTCSCNSHPAWNEYSVNRKYALFLINSYIKEKTDEIKKNEEEVKFLDDLISSLE